MLAGVLFIPTYVFGNACAKDVFNETDGLGRDTVYTASATLIGPASFGTVIGSKFITGKNENVEYFGRKWMTGGAGGVVGVQVGVMLHACCNDMDTTGLFHTDNLHRCVCRTNLAQLCTYHGQSPI